MEFAYTTAAVSDENAVHKLYFGYSGENAWGDLLTILTENDGKSHVSTNIISDNIGNLVSDGEWDYQWVHGRQLVSMYNNRVSWDFEYNADGMRISRENGSASYTYTYQGTQLWGQGDGSLVTLLINHQTKGGNIMRFSRSVILIITVCLILSCISGGVIAASEGNVVAEGTYGDNVTWVLTDAGKVIFSGTGPMSGVTYGDTGGPWSGFGYDIYSIEIGDGITSINPSAFNNHRELTSVKIGNGVKIIGKGAFFCCTSLTDITLGSSITTIESEAFSSCFELKNIVLPYGVTSIESVAFGDCWALKTITIPTSLTYIGEYAFAHDEALTDVYYGGTKSQWERITILEEENQYLLNATLHLTHDWDSGTVTKQPTCKEEGVLTYACTDCGETKTGPAAKTDSHSFGTWSSIDAAEHKHVCTVCASEVTAAHNWDAGIVTKQPTCKEEGVQTYTCTDCGETKTEPAAITNTHSFGAWSSVDAQLHKHTCTVCGNAEETAEHTWDSGAVTKQPTCKGTGVMTYSCSACAAEKTENISKSNNHTYSNNCDTSCNVCGGERTITHNYSEKLHSDAEGHWYQCEVCDAKKTEQHTPGDAATETMPQKCTECGYIITPELGHVHSYGNTWEQDDLQHWQVCACGEEADKIAHDWDSGTESLDGVSVNYICTVCSAEKTEAKPTQEETAESTDPTEALLPEEKDPSLATEPPLFVWVAVAAVVLAIAGGASAFVLIRKRNNK